VNVEKHDNFVKRFFSNYQQHPLFYLVFRSLVVKGLLIYITHNSQVRLCDFKCLCEFALHVRWVPYHNGKARSQVADEGTSFGYGG
jgi:hypothetical protein